MPRLKIQINEAEFRREVEKLESQREFANHSELWKALEQTDWAKAQQPHPLTAAVAYLRAREFGVVTKTKPGKRGLSREQMQGIQGGQRGQRSSRATKMTAFTDTFSAMRKEYPTSFLPLVRRAQKGSLRAAITLKCLECSAFQRGEARQCVVASCSLYPHRPGAGKPANEVNMLEMAEVPDAA